MCADLMTDSHRPKAPRSLIERYDLLVRDLDLNGFLETRQVPCKLIFRHYLQASVICYVQSCILTSS